MSTKPGSSNNSKATPGKRRGRGPQARKLQAAKDAIYREHIMEVAEGMFAERGFDNTKMQDIASAAGISLGTLYQTFPGKNELYRRLLITRDEQMFNEAMTRGQPVFQQPQSTEQLLWLMEAHVRFLLTHSDYLRIQLQEGYAWYHRAAQPSTDEQQLWERGLTAIEYVLEWGMREQQFVPGDSREQARLMMAMQQTRLANWVMDGMREPHEAVIARIQADFVRQFCRPAVAAGMLSEDGGHLNERTREAIRSLDQTLA